VAGSPARTSHLLVNGWAWRASARLFGQNLLESFARLNPDGCWLKTSQGYSQAMMDGSLETYSGTWPRSGTMRNGTLYRLRQLVRYIGGKGSSLWPTPTAITRPMEANVRMYRAKIAAGEMTEEEAAAILGKSVWESQGKVPALWPTPTVQDAKNNAGPSQWNRNSDPLNVAVQRWPTPVAGMAERGDRGDLNTAVKGYESSHTRMWPTPKSSPSGPDYARMSRPSSGGDDLATAVARENLPTPTANRWDGLQSHGKNVVTGQLNPTWVEWLMGFPIGWTDCEPLETP
jgi:phage-related protein